MLDFDDLSHKPEAVAVLRKAARDLAIWTEGPVGVFRSGHGVHLLAKQPVGHSRWISIYRSLVGRAQEYDGLDTEHLRFALMTERATFRIDPKAGNGPPQLWWVEPASADSDDDGVMIGGSPPRLLAAS